jgi:hypothetical protein
MKATHTAEEHANKSHRDIEAVFIEFNRATYLNLILIAIFIFILKLRRAVQRTVQHDEDT